MNPSPANLLIAAARSDESGAAWFQTTPPYGEYPMGASYQGPDKVENPVIVFDEESVAAVVDDFRRRAAENPQWTGILVDQEHFSLDSDKPSTAMAWAIDIRTEADGSIWTKWNFTPAGREMWESKELVSRSPVLELERIGKSEKFRPLRLDSIGMTNCPRFTDLSTLAKARATQNPKGDSTMDPDIIAALGLPEGATKEDALAAIQAMKAAQTTAEAKATEAEKEKEEALAQCRGFEADAYIAKNADRIADHAAFRELYVESPEFARKAVSAFRAAPCAAPQQRISAKSATPPPQNGVLEGLAKCRTAQAMAEYAVVHAKELAAIAK